MTVFQFTDYREYLKNWISLRPNKGRGQINTIAEKLNVNATLISQILSGNRQLSLEQAVNLADFINLNEVELEYFIVLVNLDRAGSERLKNIFSKKIAQLQLEAKKISQRVNANLELSEESKAIFYSSFLYSAIRLFCSIDEGKTVEDLRKKFNISKNRLDEILSFLENEGLVKKDKKFYKMGTQSTHIPQDSPFLYRHHTNWRLQSLKKIDQVQSDELIFTGPFSLDEITFHKIKNEILNLVTNASKNVKEANPKRIGCLNIDLFWLD